MLRGSTLGLFTVVLGLLLGSFLAPFAVFRRQDVAWVKEPILILNAPKGAKMFDKLKDTTAGKILSFDDSTSYFHEAAPARLYVSALKYFPGNSYFIRDVSEHSPDICLPASGAILLKGLTATQETVANLPVRLERYTFSHPLHRHPLHVYKLIWAGEKQNSSFLKGSESRWKTRFDMVRSNDKNPPGLVVFGVVYDAKDEPSAYRYFLDHMHDNCKSLEPNVM